MLAPREAENLNAVDGIRHGFFTRAGGVSTGVHAGLNCGLGSKDQTAAVVENRRRVSLHLGAAFDDVVAPYQVHSAVAIIADNPIPRADLPRADGIVTATPGLAIGILTADCTPVLFADPHARVIGAAHAGWRGAVAGVLEATVAAMEQIGADRSRVRAAIGPTISLAAYEVGPDFEAAVLAQDAGSSRFFTRTEGTARAHFDLPGYVERRLAALGLASIARQAPCTYENESLFYSYRRSTHRSEPDYGRQISAIVVT